MPGVSAWGWTKEEDVSIAERDVPLDDRPPLSYRPLSGALDLLFFPQVNVSTSGNAKIYYGKS